MTEENYNMATLLKLVREKAGISQAVAAQHVYHTRQANLSSIERGGIFPTLEIVTTAYYSMGSNMKIADFLLPE
ncbi:MAG TPA: helix-turn-helix transcriptional regulator [Ureibacillus sp.]|nr:helix-turn-helix transcriptional regulator [Ureibacillus sp.]